MLFIIWGWRGRNQTVSEGAFHCPSCASRQDYRHIQVRKFFTLYFIPLIPLDVMGEYVECSRCKGTFRSEVLSYDPERASREIRAEFETAVKRTLIHMMMADGTADPNEVDVIRKIHQDLVGRDIQPDEIQSEAVALTNSGARLSDYLASVAPHLNEHGREMIIRAACMVAAADGAMQEEERTSLMELGQVLGVSKAHFHGILLSVQSAAV